MSENWFLIGEYEWGVEMWLQIVVIKLCKLQNVKLECELLWNIWNNSSSAINEALESERKNYLHIERLVVRIQGAKASQVLSISLIEALPIAAASATALRTSMQAEQLKIPFNGCAINSLDFCHKKSCQLEDENKRITWVIDSNVNFCFYYERFSRSAVTVEW